MEWKAAHEASGIVVAPRIHGRGWSRHRVAMQASGQAIMRRIHGAGELRVSQFAKGIAVTDHSRLVLAEEREIALLIALS